MSAEMVGTAEMVGATEIVGRYTLVERLGAGSVTESFRATASSIEGFERTVVVKRLLPQHRRDADLDDCLLTTLRPTVALSHANIAQVLDVSTREGVGDGRYWVTQHVSGWSLAALLERASSRRVRLPVELTCYLALEATKGLDYAHRLNPASVIVHGNLSASNLLISYEGEVKLTDFGVALSLRRRTAADAGASASEDLVQLVQVLRQCLATSESQGGALAELPPRLAQPLERALEAGLGMSTLDAEELHELLLEGVLAERLRWSRSDLARWLNQNLSPSTIPFSIPVEGGDFAEDATAVPDSIEVSLDDSPATDKVDLLSDESVLSVAPEAAEAVPESLDVPISVHVDADSTPGPSISASLLVLTPGASLGHAVSANVAALLQRTAHDVCWLPGGQLAVVLQQTDGRDTEQAVRLGLSLLRALGPAAKQSNIAVDLTSFDPPQFDRAAARFDPDAVAQRAMPLSEHPWHSPGRVVVSRRATRELRSLFRLKRAHELGFAVMGSRTIEQASGPFFGREQDLAWLSGQLGELGSRGAIAVVGATGLGKTRLLLEFAKQLRERHEPLKVCVASCPGRGQLAPYSAILALLARIAEVREGDTSPRASRLGSVLTHVATADLERVQALLSESIAATPSLDQELRDLLSRIVRARARRAPHLIVLDNAHHADLISRILLHDIEQVFGDRAMLALLTRDDLVLHQLGVDAERQRVLQPLDDSAMAQLIAARLAVSEVPEDVLAHFAQAASGNPFVIEELLREALAQGQVVLGRNKIKSYDLSAKVEQPRSLRILAES